MNNMSDYINNYYYEILINLQNKKASIKEAFLIQC